MALSDNHHADAASVERMSIRGRAGAASLVVVVLIIAACAAFWPTLQGEFLNWDDDRNFLDNTSYRGLGWDQLHWAWQTYHLGVWQPLSWLLFGAEYELGGVEPMVYRATSLVLHVVNAVIFYFLLVAILRTASPLGRATDSAIRVGSAIAAILFAVHPLRVEAVVWVSCQPYLPAAMFSMLAVLAYLRGCGHRPGGDVRLPWLAVVFLLYLLAVASKAVAVGLPAVLLILDVYPLRRVGFVRGWLGTYPKTHVAPASSRRVFSVWGRDLDRSVLRACLEKLPFFVVAITVSIWAGAAKDYNESRVPFSEFDASARLAQAAYGLVFYLAKTALPAGLSPYYRIPNDLGLLHWPYSLAVTVVVMATTVFFVLRRRWPAVLAAWATYVIILLPNLGIVQISQQTAADRYSYLATMPVLALVAGGAARLWRGGLGRPAAARAALLVVTAVATLVLTNATRRHVRIWRDSVALWQAALAVDPGCTVAECNLGVALLEQGRLAEASHHLSAAIELDDRFAFAYSNFGVVLLAAGRPSDAVGSLETALELGDDLASRDRAKIHAALGMAYGMLREDDQARQHALRARELGFKDAQKMLDYLGRFAPSKTPR